MYNNGTDNSSKLREISLGNALLNHSILCSHEKRFFSQFGQRRPLKMKYILKEVFVHKRNNIIYFTK